MFIEDTQRQSAVDDLSILRIYFFSEANDSLLDRVLHKGITDYQRSFGYLGNVNHVAIQLGRFTYETVQEGTARYEADPEIMMLNDGRLLAFYELSLVDFDEDSRKAAQWYLNNEMREDRKWRILPCIKYLADYLWLRKFGLWLDEEIDYNLECGKMEQERGVIFYNPPFTCSTLVANALRILTGYEPMLDSHLPMSLFTTAVAMADSGIGAFISKQDITVIAL